MGLRICVVIDDIYFILNLTFCIIFRGLWKMVSPFIDAGTRAKIAFVRGEDALADLQKVIAPEVRIAQLQDGGAASLCTLWVARHCISILAAP